LSWLAGQSSADPQRPNLPATRRDRRSRTRLTALPECVIDLAYLLSFGFSAA
jgi:hypothetical protein